MKELVVELGAVFLSANLDFTPEPREDHAAYIASWFKVSKNDKRGSLPPRAMHSGPPTT